MANPKIVPSVTVVIPCFNQSAYICDALESAWNQDHQPAQIIIIDDGSSDDSLQVITAWVQQHHARSACELHVVHQENQGVAVACAHGFALVTSEYTMRLDGDDTIPPNYIAATVSLLSTQPCQVAYCYTNAEYFGDRIGTMEAQEFSAKKLLTDNFVHASALVRTEVIRALGWFSQTMTHGFEDWEFWIKLLEDGYVGCKCHQTTLNYRQQIRHGALSGRNDMAAERARAMRAKIHQLHPKLYRTPSAQLQILTWKVLRRLRRYLGISG